jgi:hypothetical protein
MEVRRTRRLVDIPSDERLKLLLTRRCYPREYPFDQKDRWTAEVILVGRIMFETLERVPVHVCDLRLETDGYMAVVVGTKPCIAAFNRLANSRIATGMNRLLGRTEVFWGYRSRPIVLASMDHEARAMEALYAGLDRGVRPRWPFDLQRERICFFALGRLVRLGKLGKEWVILSAEEATAS